MMTCKFVILLAIVVGICCGQQLPENTCAQYFRYVSDIAGGSQGELTLNLQNGRHRIDVRFSQRGAQDQAVVGALQPYPDEATVWTTLPAAKFRLSLWPDARGLLPKLTRLALNDVPLCTGTEYDPPSSYFNRFYVIYANSRQTQLSPAPALKSFGVGQSDVEVKTLIIPVDKQLPEDAIPRILTDWVNQQSTDSVVSWPVISTTSSVAPWQRPPTFTATTTSIATPAPVTFPAISTPHISLFKPIPAPTTASVIACGQAGATTPFIHGGDEYPRGAYPWLTALYHKESFALAFKCGGSLISTSLIITAAHCVYKIEDHRVVVAMGRYDLENYDEDGTEMRQVMRIKLHPEYTSRLQFQPDADIALVTVDRPVIFNDLIRPICLWEATQTEVATSSGSIAGWGTDEKGNTMTRYPRIVTAKIATEAECIHKWKVQKVLERTLCAGNLDGTGPCLGDSGGGLMVNRNNRWMLRGIVSQGEKSAVGSCNLNQYVLYCDLSKHMTWISENIS